MSNCLTEQRIELLATKGTPDKESAAALRHLDTCPNCRRAVAAFIRASPVPERAEESPEPTTLPHRRPLEDSTLFPGTPFGRYRVLHQVGSGAMGVVYAAYDPNLDRWVALKLVRAAASELGFRGRLFREAKALAKLSHPNVVTVHDAGEIGNEVFIAMEYVEGQTLGSWLRAVRSSSEILHVFAQAAEGLNAAHRAGLVHRDFKPENVLVGNDGRVRVTDFGLARQVPPANASPATEGRGAAALEQDKTQGSTGVVGTPRYMAPEQLKGEGATACSDIYSFCVALHEALYRKHPLALGAPGNSHPGPAALPGVKGQIPRAVQVALQRGLREHPKDRAQSLDELINAITTSARRRVWKRWVAVGLSFQLLLGAAALWAWTRSTRCEGFREEVENIWTEQEAAIGRAFRQSGRPYAEQSLLSVSQAVAQYLDRWAGTRASACVASQRESRAAPRPPGQVLCLDRKLNELRSLLAIFATATPEVVDRAVQASLSLTAPASCLRATSDPMTWMPEDPTLHPAVQAMHLRLAEARAQLHAGNYPRAVSEAASVQSEAKPLHFRPLHVEATLLWGLAAAQLDSDDAAPKLKEALLSAEAMGHESAVFDAWIALARYRLHKHADYAQTEDALLHAEATMERMGRSTSQEATVSITRGQWLFETSRLAEAEAAVRNAIQKLENGDPLELGRALNMLGILLNTRGHYEEAATTYQQALAVRSRTLGGRHPEVGMSLNGLANVFHNQGKHPESLALYEQALAIYRGIFGETHALVAGTLNNIGIVHARLRNFAQADRAMQEAINIRKAVNGPEHPKVAMGLTNLAESKLEQGQVQSALELFSQAEQIFRTKLGPRHVHLASTLSGVGRAHLEARSLPSARAALEQAFAIWEQEEGNTLERADARFAYGQALWLSGQRGKGLQALTAAERQYRELEQPAHDKAERVRQWMERYRVRR